MENAWTLDSASRPFCSDSNNSSKSSRSHSSPRWSRHLYRRSLLEPQWSADLWFHSKHVSETALVDCFFFFLTPHSSDEPIRFCAPDTPPLPKKIGCASLVGNSTGEGALCGQRTITQHVVHTGRHVGILNTFSCFVDFGLLPALRLSQ